jgi:hypothetical protein
MTRPPWYPENGPTTRKEFEQALDELVRTAAANGVRVRGGFGLRHPAPDSPDWAVEFTRLRQRRIGSDPTDSCE